MPDPLLEVLDRIESRLSQLVSLAAAGSLEGLSQKAKVEKLAALGFDVKSICAVTSLARTTVSPIVSQWKKAQ